MWGSFAGVKTELAMWKDHLRTSVQTYGIVWGDNNREALLHVQCLPLKAVHGDLVGGHLRVFSESQVSQGQVRVRSGSVANVTEVPQQPIHKATHTRQCAKVNVITEWLCA